MDLLQPENRDHAPVAIEPAAAAESTPELWIDWAAAQVSCGRPDLAEQGYRKALALDASHRNAAVNLGLLLFARGSLAEGMSLLESHKGTLTAAEKQTLLNLASRFQSEISASRQQPPQHHPLSTIQINLDGEQIPFRFRHNSAGDKGVIQQIFVNREYAIDHWVQGKLLIRYHQANVALRPSLIVDAGANIGASALYFSKVFPGSVIFTIEPDPANSEILAANTAHDRRIFNYRGAVSNTDGELLLIDPGLSDWGFRTVANPAAGVQNRGVVNSISPSTILAHPQTANATPLIFKIDIEGAEQFLFEGNTAWMKQFPLIIIELHDWLLPCSGSSRSFIKAAAQYDFDFLQRGENLFLFNRELLAGR